MNPHDPLCPEFEDYPLNGYQCCCDVIATVRVDEKSQALEWIDSPGWTSLGAAFYEGGEYDDDGVGRLIIHFPVDVDVAKTIAERNLKVCALILVKDLEES